jgi:transposase InsO family protein
VATTGDINSSDIRDLMVESVERRFGLVDKLPKPIEWLSDNGSPYTAGETRALARDIGLVPCTTPIQSPQSNGMAEAFVKLIKRDYARVSAKPDAASVLRQLDSWFEHYNTVHPIRRWATARRASSENRWWRRRPGARSAQCVDRMTAQRPRRRSGPGQSRRRRGRAAPALT